MSRFMLVLHVNNDELRAMTPEQQQTLLQHYMTWTAQLRQEGYYLGGDALKDGELAVHARDGQPVVDGPFAETKESIGGYYEIKATDLAAASEVAKGCPVLTYGGRVEVREIQEWN